MLIFRPLFGHGLTILRVFDLNRHFLYVTTTLRNQIMPMGDSPHEDMGGATPEVHKFTQRLRGGAEKVLLLFRDIVVGPDSYGN